MAFSKDFVWGVSSSAYQIEGACNEDGRKPSIWDEYCKREGAISRGHNGDIAVDFYHRYKEDVELMKQMGIKNYHFSISWPRVLPDGRGKVNEKGLAFYDKLVDLLLENGIAPYISLYHWDLPLTLGREGGWLNRKTSEAFGEFASVIAKHFNGRVYDYATLVEPQVTIHHGYENGFYAPGLKLYNEDLAVSIHNHLLAHGLAVRALRDNSIIPVKVSIETTGNLYYPVEETPENCNAARDKTFAMPDVDWTFNHNLYLDPVILGHYPEDVPSPMREFAATVSKDDWNIIKNDLDYLCANIYYSTPVDADGKDVVPTGFPVNTLKWLITPEAIRYGSRWLYERYGLPIYISENGISCADRIHLDGKVHDPDRIDFTHRYLKELKKGIEEGIPIKGYFHWSLTDNFEWACGYEERFGLIFIDYASQRRILKDSAYWYADVIKYNGENL